MSDRAERFGENVRGLRRRAGLSAEELAERAAINRSCVGRIERAKIEPRLWTLVRLVGALGTTPDEILDGIEWRPGGEEKGR